MLLTSFTLLAPVGAARLSMTGLQGISQLPFDIKPAPLKSGLVLSLEYGVCKLSTVNLITGYNGLFS
jgi:hypothetical protein